MASQAGDGLINWEVAQAKFDHVLRWSDSWSPLIDEYRLLIIALCVFGLIGSVSEFIKYLIKRQPKPIPSLAHFTSRKNANEIRDCQFILCRGCVHAVEITAYARHRRLLPIRSEKERKWFTVLHKLWLDRLFRYLQAKLVLFRRTCGMMVRPSRTVAKEYIPSRHLVHFRLIMAIGLYTAWKMENRHFYAVFCFLPIRGLRGNAHYPSSGRLYVYNFLIDAVCYTVLVVGFFI